MAKLSENINFGKDFRVGLMAFFALILLITGLAFAGGEKGLLLAKTFSFRAYLPDVGGLKRGCTITMGGMAVGQVTSVEFAEAGAPHNIAVTMQLRSDIRDRIKSDSVPSVRTQGMLGDRYLEISHGSPEAAALEEGKYLVGNGASTFDETLSQATQVLSETQKVLGAVNQKQGTVGQLFYDEAFYSNMVKIAEDLNALILDVKENPKKYLKFSVF